MDEDKEVDQKYDIIEDMENELDQIERNVKEAKKEPEFKEIELNQLEKFITEQVEEINILRDNNQSMVSQIAENIRMENKIKYQDEIIKDLKEKLASGTVRNDELKKEDLVESNEEEENLKLHYEIKQLEKINGEKENQLEKLTTENKELEEKLKVMHLACPKGQA